MSKLKEWERQSGVNLDNFTENANKNSSLGELILRLKKGFSNIEESNQFETIIEGYNILFNIFYSGKMFSLWIKDFLLLNAKLLKNNEKIFRHYLEKTLENDYAWENLCILGFFYEYGIGIKKPDSQKALQYYTLATTGGNASAQNHLGNFYQQSTEITDKSIYKKAVECYTLAAAQGHTGGQANLGFCHQCAIGMEKSDPQKAVKCYTLAAAEGSAFAQNYLGYCYQHGIGMEKPDLQEAVRYYTLAAVQGHAIAQFNLAQCYQYGIGMEKSDPQKALDYYKLAAIQGHKDAQNILMKGSLITGEGERYIFVFTNPNKSVTAGNGQIISSQTTTVSEFTPIITNAEPVYKSVINSNSNNGNKLINDESDQIRTLKEKNSDLENRLKALETDYKAFAALGKSEIEELKNQVNLLKTRMSQAQPSLLYQSPPMIQMSSTPGQTPIPSFHELISVLDKNEEEITEENDIPEPGSQNKKRRKQ